MSRRKTRAKELARRWRKKKHLRQKLRQVRNKAEAVERAIQRMDEPEKQFVFSSLNISVGGWQQCQPSPGGAVVQPMRRLWP